MQLADLAPLLEGAAAEVTPGTESSEEAYRHIQRLKQQLAAIGGIDTEVVREHTGKPPRVMKR